MHRDRGTGPLFCLTVEVKTSVVERRSGVLGKGVVVRGELWGGGRREKKKAQRYTYR